jgi:hypothetical protein
MRELELIEGHLDVLPDVSTLPNLERLIVRDAAFDVGALASESLRELHLLSTTGHLAPDVTAMTCPRLETLVVHTRTNGARIAPLLGATNLPALRRLTLTTEFPAAKLVALVAASPIARQLTELVIGGEDRDGAAAAFAAAKAQLAHLARFELV